MKESGSVPDTSQGQFKPSNEQMLVSIKACMEQLVEEVSGMAEILVQLQQDYTEDLKVMT